MRSLLVACQNDADDEELYRTVVEGIELLSPNGNPRHEFLNVAQRMAEKLDKFKDERFQKVKKNVIGNKFNVDNIQASIKTADENLN
jgi:hypothetical protein